MFKSSLAELPDTRVTHTVSVVAVGLEFHENGTLIKHRKTRDGEETIDGSISSFKLMNGFHLPCRTGSAQLQALLLPEHKEHPSRPPGHRTSKHFTPQPQSTLHSHANFVKHSSKKKERKKARSVPWDQEWILLSCNSLCWLQLAPLTCPFRTCCFHR